jgi:EAL domain-containing protein (putative c-di-GMP-specific phosphodiesterase class I)
LQLCYNVTLCKRQFSQANARVQRTATEYELHGMTDKALAKDDTAERLIEALNQDGFVLYSQRIAPLRPGKEPYQEILVRFKEEEQKLLPPGTFIPILESSRLMHILDRWVINRVIKWIHAKRKSDPAWNAPCSSINLSNDSLANAEFPGFVRTQLEKGKISGRKFAFEVAEEDAATHEEGLARFTTTLLPLGCRFTLTSYNGNLFPVEKLKASGIDGVKIDIEIIASLHASEASFAQTKAIQSCCEAQGLSTLGEFVERPETLQKLKELGVHYAQGYGIAMPEPLA